MSAPLPPGGDRGWLVVTCEVGTGNEGEEIPGGGEGGGCEGLGEGVVAAAPGQRAAVPTAFAAFQEPVLWTADVQSFLSALDQRGPA